MNPWELIGSYRSHFHTDLPAILWEESYLNLVMFAVSVPVPDKEGKDTPGREKVVDLTRNPQLMKLFFKGRP